MRAIVVLKDAPAASFAKRGTSAQDSARKQVQAGQEAVRRQMQGIDYELQYSFDTLLNGFSCDVAYGDLDAIAQIPGVDAVYVANSYSAPAVTPEKSTKMASSNAATGVNDMRYGEYYGEGIVIAVLDTGLNTTHEAFQTNEVMEETGRLTPDDLRLTVASGTYLSAKVPYAYDYADKDDDVTDVIGHGTHVSGIAAGLTVEEDGTWSFNGVAPYAQIVSMKIFSDVGSSATNDVYFRALEDAYRLGVDVINLSIGAQNGFTYDSALETEIFGNIYERLTASGIVMSVAAGNEYSMAQYSAAGYIGTEYQDYGTIASPASYTGSTSVASMENLSYPGIAAVIGTGSSAAAFEYYDTCNDGINEWATAFNGTSTAFAIVADGEGRNPLGSGVSLGYAEDFAAADVSGKIAVLQRGELAFEEKVENAAAAGAVGCVVLNTVNDLFGMSVETYEIPAISLPANALGYLCTAASGEDAVLSFPEEMQTVINPTAGEMSGYSNWGPTPNLTLDPAITSIGGDVYSAVQSGDSDYEVYSGTSMATPNFTGAVALLLQYLKEQTSGLSKEDRSKLAVALFESTATPVTDAEGNFYSARKQGAGLANVYLAADAYENSAYLTAPLQELGDDPEKLGVYSFDVTLSNRNAAMRDTYFVPHATLLCDTAENIGSADEPVYANTLEAMPLAQGVDYEIRFERDGEDVSGGFLLLNGEDACVTVTITLTEEAMAAFAEQFQVGNYIDGFVFFDDIEVTEDLSPVYVDDADQRYLYDVEQNHYYRIDEAGLPLLDAGNQRILAQGEVTFHVYHALHCTLLAFFGDWTEGAVLESTDFADYIEANVFASTTVADEEGNTYAELGYDPMSFMEEVCYTRPNLAFTAIADDHDEAEMLTYYVGDNMLDVVDYVPAHNAFSTREYDGSYAQSNAIYITPSQLRNLESLTMYVTDAETGEYYYMTDLSYLSKCSYDETNEVWYPDGGFTWTGKDFYGDYVPSGTVVNISFDAILPWNGTYVSNVWDFDVEVDYTAPLVLAAEFDEEAATLTVTATDESYLAGAYLIEPENGNMIAMEAVSSDVEGETFDIVFDVSEFVGLYQTVDVVAMDYATNESFHYTAPLYTVGLDASVTLNTPYGKQEYPVKTGDCFTFPAAEAVDGYVFQGWTLDPVQRLEADEPLDLWAKEGTQITVTEDITLYALYACGSVQKLDPARFTVPDEFEDDMSGIWALVGYEVDEDGYQIVSEPKVMGAEGETIDIVSEFGAVVSEDTLLFTTNEPSIRYEVSRTDAGTYTFRSVSSGKYLSLDEYNLVTLVDEPDEYAQWTIEIVYDYDNSVLIYNAELTNYVLLYDDGYDEFYAFDDTIEVDTDFGSYPPWNWYYLWLFRCEEEGLLAQYYTTQIELPEEEAPTCYFASLTDCPDSWYHEAIDFVYANGLMNGVGKNHFEPSETMTRAMMVTVLYRMAGSPAVDTGADFADVDKEAYYADAIAWAQAEKIVDGVGGGLFEPDAPVTREQLATILWRYEKQPDTTADLKPFADADAISGYAVDAIAWAVSSGLLIGDNGCLRPCDASTRAEFATVIMRYLDGSYPCASLK